MYTMHILTINVIFIVVEEKCDEGSTTHVLDSSHTSGWNISGAGGIKKALRGSGSEVVADTNEAITIVPEFVNSFDLMDLSFHVVFARKVIFDITILGVDGKETVVSVIVSNR